MTNATASITEQDIAGIKELRDPWIQACLDRQWDSLLQLCTSDIVFLPPDAPIADGQNACRAYLEEYPVMKSFTFDFEKIVGQGDHASARGSFRIVAEIEGSDVTMVGKFLDTFRKSDGRWRYDAVMWSPDHPVG